MTPSANIYTIHSASQGEEDSVDNDRNPLETSLKQEDYQVDTEADEVDEETEEELISPQEDLDPQDLESIALIYDNVRVLRRGHVSSASMKSS